MSEKCSNRVTQAKIVTTPTCVVDNKVLFKYSCLSISITLDISGMIDCINCHVLVYATYFI